MPSDAKDVGKPRLSLRSFAKKVKCFFSVVDESIVLVLGRTRLGAFIYYLLHFNKFLQEHHGVLAGRRAYYISRRRPSSTSALLRRNVHRIEKGLIMFPRRRVFACDFIGETVGIYKAVLNGDAGRDSSEEILWARDVLDSYFSVADQENLIIKQAYRDFSPLLHPVDVESHRRPYKRDLESPRPFGYDEMLQMAKLRRSVRWYVPKAVPRELVDKALVVGGLSPSACNRQPFEFLVFDDPSKVAELSSIPGGTTGFNHNFPGFVVVIGRQDAYFSERDRHLVYIDASLATMSFVYALESLGVGTCIINWPDVAKSEKRIRKLLGLLPYQRIIMTLSYGFPDPERMVPYSQKKPLSQIRSYNR